MSQDIQIDAAVRTEFGKGASRQYRRDGRIPAVMYGTGSEVRHITLPGHELDLALRIPRVVLDVEVEGTRIIVAPADVQRDPVRTDLLHVDLLLLSDAEVNERHAYADALAAAEANAEEAGEDLADVAARVVQIIEERNKALAEASAAAAAAEDAAAEAGEVSETVESEGEAAAE